MEIQKYLQLESQLKELDDIEINGFQIWRLVRTKFRDEILGVQDSTIKPIIKPSQIISDSWNSFKAFKKICHEKQKVDYLFFPHPRLFLVDGKYIERMSDPLIDYSGIGDNYYVFERYQNGIHQTPRMHGERVIYLDYLENIATFFRLLYKPFFKLRYGKLVEELISILNDKFEFDETKIRKLFFKEISFSFLRKKLLSPYLKTLSPQKVFLATRDSFRYVISYCKEHDITTVELQHGITIGETSLYSGDYSIKSDPDYFFVFGAASIGPQFGIPVERIRNVGFPYKNYISTIGLKKYDNDTSLIISEPHITDKLLSIVASLSSEYPQHVFHIRCHPNERLSEDQISLIKNMKNVEVVDNKVESFCALSQYEQIIGENSTCLYEAMSLGKKVARINFGGLEVVESSFIHGGFILNKIEDLEKFLSEPYDSSRDSNDLYSDFDKNQIESFFVKIVV